MALTQREDHRVDIAEDRTINVRVATIIENDTDGSRVATSYRRYTLVPGADVSGEPQEIQDIAAVVHTQERIDAYQAKVSADDNY